ncbi:hypothetical protein [Streptomyces abikoensis]|uniref:Uncharacterized protein n=1 Tax=Streptomyces abikoensis TaxID=97398 RepID=A0ABW7THE9_9ACTN
MALMSLFTRRVDNTPPETTAPPREPEAPKAIMRFLTQGGAPVDLRPARFTTRFDYRGAPYAADKPYEIDGFNWHCTGCTSYGREGDTYNDPGYRSLEEARTKANAHAEKCRSVVLPNQASA